MKCLYTLLITLLVCFSNFAQDPQLFENNWFLQKVTIEDVDYFPPNVIGEQETGTIKFYEEVSFIDIKYCDIFGPIIEYDSNENTFTLEDDPVVLPGECLNSENNVFAGLYYSIFFDQTVAKNPFIYAFVNVGEILMMIIENSFGDQAIYNNLILESPDFEIAELIIYPNPVTNTITIKNKSHNPIISIIIYDVLGRLVLEKNNPSNHLDISKLDSGLLFLTIETDKGVFTKKIIKQ